MDFIAFDEVFHIHYTVRFTPDRTKITSVDGEFKWIWAAQQNQLDLFKNVVQPSSKLLANEKALGTTTSDTIDDFTAEEYA